MFLLAGALVGILKLSVVLEVLYVLLGSAGGYCRHSANTALYTSGIKVLGAPGVL